MDLAAVCEMLDDLADSVGNAADGIRAAGGDLVTQAFPELFDTLDEAKALLVKAANMVAAR